MSSQIQYFPPVDEIDVLSNEIVSPLNAAELIRTFAENQSDDHELPSMTLYYLKEMYSSVVANAPLLSAKEKKEKKEKKKKKVTDEKISDA